MNKQILNLQLIIGVALISTAMIIKPSIVSTVYAQTAPPPNLGEETKGTPAVAEEPSAGVEQPSTETQTVATESTSESEETQSTSAFGRATVVESRRESGQVYSIELQHSNAPNQYIEETDSDGNIEFESNDIEETPNLPKWKLGSW